MHKKKRKRKRHTHEHKQRTIARVLKKFRQLLPSILGIGLVNPGKKNKRRTFDQTNGLTLSLTVSPWKLSRLEAARRRVPPRQPPVGFVLFRPALSAQPRPVVPRCRWLVGPTFRQYPRGASLSPFFGGRVRRFANRYRIRLRLFDHQHSSVCNVCLFVYTYVCLCTGVLCVCV